LQLKCKQCGTEVFHNDQHCPICLGKIFIKYEKEKRTVKKKKHNPNLTTKTVPEETLDPTFETISLSLGSYPLSESDKKKIYKENKNQYVVGVFLLSLSILFVICHFFYCLILIIPIFIGIIGVILILDFLFVQLSISKKQIIKTHIDSFFHKSSSIDVYTSHGLNFNNFPEELYSVYKNNRNVRICYVGLMFENYLLEISNDNFDRLTQ